MYLQRRFWSLLVTLGFVLSVLAVFAPAGAASGRAENFVVTVTFTNPGGGNDNSSAWTDAAPVNVTANVSIAAGMENVTDLKLELKVDGTLEGTVQSLGELNATEFKEYTWPWYPSIYGDFELTVMAVNGTDHANHTVVTRFYRSLDSDIVVGEVTLSAQSALIGVDQVAITASLANNGNAPGTANVTFSAGTTVLGFVEKSVPAGESADAVLSTDFGGLGVPDGEYAVKAAMSDWQDSEATSAQNITLATPEANVTITGLSVNPASGYEGAAVTFTVTLVNDGTADAADISIGFSVYELIIYMPIGEKPNVTVPKGQTVNATWAWALPNITGSTENKTVRAKYGESFQTVNVTVNKKLPKLEITSFAMPAGKRVYDFVEVSVTVKNNGTANATGVVVKLMEGGWTFTNMTDPFNLTIGESKTVKLGITIMDEGSDINRTFTAVATVGGVETKSDSKVFVGHQIYAAIGIQSFKITPAKKDNQPKDSSQSFTATLSLKNIGEKAGSVQLMLMEGTGLKAKLLANQTVSVDPNATKEVKVSFKVKGAGKHTVTAVVSLPNPDTGNMTKSATCELQYSSPGFEVVVLIAAMIAGAVFVRRRKD